MIKKKKKIQLKIKTTKMKSTLPWIKGVYLAAIKPCHVIIERKVPVDSRKSDKVDTFF